MINISINLSIHQPPPSPADLVAEGGVAGHEAEHDNVQRQDNVHQGQHGQQQPAGVRLPGSINQSINQSINHSINQSINQSINHEINQS